MAFKNKSMNGTPQNCNKVEWVEGVSCILLSFKIGIICNKLQDTRWQQRLGTQVARVSIW
jgi:hypothetical protein